MQRCVRQPALLLAVLALALVACGGPPEPGAPPAGGGEVVAKADDGDVPLPLDQRFPSTVYIPDCTASKVGPRALLTAAHCVTNAGTMTLDREFEPGAALTLYTGEDLAAAGEAHPVRVLGTFIHPSYAAALVRAQGKGIPKADYDTVFDLALIVVDRDTPEIAEGTLDHEPLPLSPPQAIQLGGYGRAGLLPGFFDGTAIVSASGRLDEGDGGDAPHAPTNQLHYRRTSVAVAEGTVYRVHNGRWVEGRGWVITDGLGAEDELRLLPGDSGGPVLRDDTAVDDAITQQRFDVIVGVNAFANPFYSSFVRLDLPASRDCLVAALTDGVPADLRCGALPLLCAPAATAVTP